MKIPYASIRLQPLSISSLNQQGKAYKAQFAYNFETLQLNNETPQDNSRTVLPTQPGPTFALAEIQNMDCKSENMIALANNLES